MGELGESAKPSVWMPVLDERSLVPRPAVAMSQWLHEHWPSALLLSAGLTFFVVTAIGVDASRMPGDPGDARLVLYLLEHTYRWLTTGFFGLLGDYPLFDPPVFYPAPNILAYSELFLGVAPVFWAWRLLGLSTHSAAQAWCLTVLALDFVVFYRWLTHGLERAPAAAALGATVFTFGTLRLGEALHYQVLPQFYTALVAYGLTMLLRRPEAPGAWRWGAVAAGAAVCELYSSFYNGFFLGVGLLLVAPLSLLTVEGRALARRLLAARPWHLLATALVAALALLPMTLRYLETVRTVGLRSYADLNAAALTPGIWLNMGPENWLWGLLSTPGRAPLLSDTMPVAGIGPIAMVLGLTGLLLARRRWAPVLLAWVLIVLLVTCWPGGIHAWKLVFHALPGAKGIRALMRIAILTTVFAGLGVTLLMEHLGRRRLALALVLGALVLAEMPRAIPSFPKAWSEQRVAALAQRIGELHCRAWYYSPIVTPETSREGPWYRLHWVRFQTEAMLAQHEVGVPTVNGYTGNYPPGWLLSDPIIDDPEDPERLRARLASWARLHGLSEEGFCWLRDVVTE